MNKNVKIIEKLAYYQGFARFYGYYLKHRLFSGGWSAKLHRECVIHKPVVGVLPYDPVLKRVVLIEQFRVGLVESKENPWLLEVVAGYIEPGEVAEQVAHRELLEETGLKAVQLTPLHAYWVSPGGSNAHVTLFYAKVDASQAGGIHGVSDEHEDIRVHTLSLEEAITSLNQGVIAHSMAIIALQWLQLNSGNL